jgi:hypothetical protein
MKSESGVESYITFKSFIKTIVLLGLFFVLCSSVISLGKKYIVLRKNIQSLKEAQSLLVDKKIKLEEKTALLKTPLGQEITIRDKYRVVKPNEGVVVITTPAAVSVEVKKSRIVRFWDMIVGIFH